MQQKLIKPVQSRVLLHPQQRGQDPHIEYGGRHKEEGVDSDADDLRVPKHHIRRKTGYVGFQRRWLTAIHFCFWDIHVSHFAQFSSSI